MIFKSMPDMMMKLLLGPRPERSGISGKSHSAMIGRMRAIFGGELGRRPQVAGIVQETCRRDAAQVVMQAGKAEIFAAGASWRYQAVFRAE